MPGEAPLRRLPAGPIAVKPRTASVLSRRAHHHGEPTQQKSHSDNNRTRTIFPFTRPALSRVTASAAIDLSTAT